VPPFVNIFRLLARQPIAIRSQLAHPSKTIVSICRSGESILEQKNKSIPDQSLAIIGPGRVGTTIAIAAQKAGYTLKAIAGRDKDKTELAAKAIGDAKVLTLDNQPIEASIILLTVPDDAIESVCNELSQNKVFTPGQIVAHCSGALSSEVLAKARDICGAKIASAHPLQTFSTAQSSIDFIPGTFWFCEGEATAVAALSSMIESIGGIPKIIATDKKVLYHCSSVIACNYLVSLMDIALTTAEAAGLDPQLAWQALSPLIQKTITNIDQLGTSGALTGPIARGDVNTIKMHLNALNKTDPKLAQLYKQLGDWTVKVAEQKGLPKDKAQALKAELEK